MKKSGFFAASLTMLVACSPKTAEVVEKVENEEYPTAAIGEGSALYAANCGKCHKLKTVTDYTAEQWQKIVPPMAQKAKLDATQQDKVLQYVLWRVQ